MLPLDFYRRDVGVVAAALIGAILTVDGVGGRIVETEAYAADDPASHSFNGPTARNAAMFGPAGCAYVYRIYGLHLCLNVTCGNGSAVLIRALEPLLNIEMMMARRGTAKIELLCAGPGRLCQALGVTATHNGLPMDATPFALVEGDRVDHVAAGPRIGITRGAETPWRFCATGSRFLSRAVRPA
jgi:DNA-3-methyladenine glycosylase